MSYRISPLADLKIYDKTRLLITANLVMALLSIIIGGIAALFVAGGRSTVSSLINVLGITHENYYIWLTLHGINMLIFWIIWAEITIVYFAGAVLLNSELYSIRLAWMAFAFMLIGQIMIEILVASGNASVLFTAYPPLAAHPLFYVGYLLFALGAGIAVIIFFLTIYNAKIKGAYTGSLPLVTWGAGIAAIIALTVVIQGAISMLYTLLWRVGLMPMNVMVYRWYFWGLGHDAQYLNISATIAVLYALVVLGTGLAAIRFINERYARIAFVLYPIFVVPGIGHHILVDPGWSYALKQASGSVGSHFLSVPTLLHGLALAGAIESVIRASGHTSLFGWIRKIPWSNPAISTTVLSLILIGFGGIIAQPQTTLQPNVNYHNTLWVPGHFHTLVAGATTMAFMVLFYYAIPALTSKKIYSVKIAKIQPYVFFFGILILATTMSVAGFNGSPRRTFFYPEMTLPQWTWVSPLIIVGALIAIIGGILFVFNIVATIFLSKPQKENVFEGLMTSFEIKTSKASKTGSLALCIIVGLILLLLYFYSFARLAGMPIFY